MKRPIEVTLSLIYSFAIVGLCAIAAVLVLLYLKNLTVRLSI
jgi:hypothetical protein